MKKAIAALAAVSLYTATTVSAVAGTAVTGVGDSPAQAMNDANNRAAAESRSRWGRSTCYTPATYERCRKDGNGYWICTAFVNNQAGSGC